MIVRKINLKLKWLFYDLVAFLGAKPNLNKRKGEVQFLCFHGVCNDDDKYINGRFYKESLLKELLFRIKKESNIISLDDYLNQKINREKLNVVLTFDDGYKNNLTHMFPIIEELGIPVTVFVTAKGKTPLWQDILDIISENSISLKKLEFEFPEIKGKTNAELKRWLISQSSDVVDGVSGILEQIAEKLLSEKQNFCELLSKEELKTFNENHLVSIANHSANHYNFNTLTKEKMREEFQQCENYLKEIGSVSSSVFAYPFGIYNSETIETLNALGARIQFSTDEITSKSKGVVARLVINPFISVQNQLRAISNGKY